MQRIKKGLSIFSKNEAVFIQLSLKYYFHLTLSWRRPLSYRNQSFDLFRNSMDWFLNDKGLCHEELKVPTQLSDCRQIYWETFKFFSRCVTKLRPREKNCLFPSDRVSKKAHPGGRKKNSSPGDSCVLILSSTLTLKLCSTWSY